MRIARSTRATFRDHAARGFTLPELLVVVTLTGVLAGAVGVALHGRVEPHRLRVAAEDWAATVRYTHSATLDDRPHRVRMDESRQAYRVEQAIDADGRRRWRPVRGRAGRWRLLPAGITLRVIDDANSASPRATQQDRAAVLWQRGGLDHRPAAAWRLASRPGGALHVRSLVETGWVGVVEP
jgi:prepilin-type N-terminal cleavage/methylation domain-containing protein